MRTLLATSRLVSFALLVCATGAAPAATAGEVSYRCTVTQVLNHQLVNNQLDGSGPKVKLVDEKLMESYSNIRVAVGSRFEVSRETGKMTGFPFEKSDAVVTLLQRGSASLPQMILRNRSDGIVVELVQIFGYVDGPRKPFVALSSFRGVIAGFCD